MKTIHCPKGKSTKIISNFGRGFSQIFNLTITTDSETNISGTYIEQKYFWIFPQKPITGKLEAQMQFHRRWIDGIYSITIIPDIDVVVKRK